VSRPAVTTRLHYLIGTFECRVIQGGTGLVEIDGRSALVGRGDRIVIPAGVAPRITSTGAGDLVLQCVCAPRLRPENSVDLGG